MPTTTAPVLDPTKAECQRFSQGWFRHDFSSLYKRAIRVRFTRARRTDAIQQLREERSELYDGMIGLSKGLELPGTLAKDGRVLEEKKGQAIHLPDK